MTRFSVGKSGQLRQKDLKSRRLGRCPSKQLTGAQAAVSEKGKGLTGRLSLLYDLLKNKVSGTERDWKASPASRRERTA